MRQGLRCPPCARGARPCDARATLAWLARSMAVLLLCWVLPAAATILPVKDGDNVTLAESEGLLVIGIDSTAPLELLGLVREGDAPVSGTLRRVGAGRSLRMYRMPAGRYRWDQVRVDSQTHAPAPADAFRFEVKAGHVNYPGDLLVRTRGWVRVDFDLANRGLAALDWLDANHPALSKRLPFAYAGHYPDPFPAFYRDVQARHGALTDTVLPPPPTGAPLPMAIEPLWRPGRFVDVRLNAGGDLLAEVVHENGTWAVDLFDLVAGTCTRLLDSDEAITHVVWASDRSLVVSEGDGASDRVTVMRIVDRADGSRDYLQLRIPRRGRVVDVMPQADRILFASHARKRLLVHEIDVRTQASIDMQRFRSGDARNAGVANDEAWFVDGNGTLRVAIARAVDGFTLHHGRDGSFQPVPRFADLQGFQPHGLSADGNVLYGITDRGREQAELVALDLVAGRIGDTLFARPGTDVVAPVFDAGRRLIGASYYEDGQLVSEYFDEDNARLARRLRKAFPDRTVHVLDRDEQHRNLIVGVGGSDQPSRLYHLDLQTRQASLLDESRPWLSGHTFAPTHVLRSTSRDGLAIESYLTLPPGGDGKRPLVVFPHGGPIGIRDARQFDPEVQFLASLGYAVLQVNFRGSAGFGRAFRDAGERSYGSLIEDDIDAAINTALAEHPLDPTRMCAIGASYGGYSALVSAIRWPGRFRCAISVAGISDRILFFTASDTGRSDSGRALLEKAIGDPTRDAEAMLRYSPLYRYAELDLPVMLAHGTEDRRVDYEHTRRLVRLLSAAGRTPVLLTLEGEGHGIADPLARERLWEGIAGFLRQHLSAPDD